jgi:pilus assembly protein CpaC
MRKFLYILLIAVAAQGVVFADDVASVRLLVGRSTVIDVGSAIARVSLTSADVADAVVTSANQLLVNGKMPGTISMYVWERSGGLRRYEIVVQRDLARLNDQMKVLFPGESIDAQTSGKGIILSGIVSSKEVSDKALNVAGGYVDKPDEVVNLLHMQESTASNQVLLQVRFAEVSRTAVMDLGASLFTGAGGYKNLLARTTTDTPAPTFDDTKLVFSDFLNLFLFDAKHQLGTVIKALQTKGQFQSLAEPNLVAESGKDASFLAGGEFPVPIATNTGGALAISVSYKEFGVRLNFTPIIHGDRVHLKVKPEVSTLDFANGVLLNGFRIPALSTRRTETEVDLEDGQTFAISGLINNTMNNTLQKIPGIGDIPILGLLFKSKAASKDQTELVVMITPHILPRNSPGVTNTLPRTPEQFLPPMPANKMVAPLPPAFTPARGWSGADASTAPVTPAATPTTTSAAAPVAAPSSPAAAAAILSPTPTARPVVDGNALTARPIVTPASDVARPLSSDEKKVLERSRKQDEVVKTATAKEQAKQTVVDKRNKELSDEQELKISQERGKLAREQAKRDAENAKVQAKHDAEAAKVQAKHDAEAAKIAAEEAKRQGEIERVHQKALDEAAAKAKEADAKYQADLSRKQR